ncbi:MAG: DNA primase small subunit domain-containing protein [Candidatus Aenigmatarchaeota archaeon]
MNRQHLMDYYSNEHVISELLNSAKGREVAGAFWDGRYDQRPNILQYPSDVVQMIRKGVTSFHISVEHWTNPMAITNENYEKLRSGWDIILDIDSKLGLDESKLAADMIIRLLRKYGIKNPGIKFSGRRGFHICLPWSMFPKEIDYKSLTKMYPEVPRIIASFIRKKIRGRLLKELVRTKGAKQLIEILGESPSKLNPFYFVEIEKMWGNRHMFRAPYSLNEKTWLVSVPIKPSGLKGFSPKDAEFGNVLSKKHPDFFEAGDDAADLLTDAMDWNALRKKEEPKKEVKKIVWENKVPEELFPPCIKNILAGLQDGRKRSIFTLTNFLRMMNWPAQEIEAKVFEWNQKNKQPLPTNILLGQIRWSQTNLRTPANCFNDQFYKSFGICTPDDHCKFLNSKKVSNPVAYPFRKMKRSTYTKKRKMRGFSCLCGKEFPTMRSLALHKGKVH